jgi:hypothetical protein
MNLQGIFWNTSQGAVTQRAAINTMRNWTMSGTPKLGTSTRPNQTGSGVSPAGKELARKQTIKEARIKASNTSPAPTKAEEKRHGTSARSDGRRKHLHRQRSTSSPTRPAKEETPRQTPGRSFPPIDLSLLFTGPSLRSDPKPDPKPTHNGPPPGPWNLKSPRDSARGRGGMIAPTPEWIMKLPLDELATQSESLQTKVSGLTALYSQWWLWYDTFPKCNSAHPDVIAEHQKLKASTEAAGWDLHDALQDAKASRHVIDVRMEALQKG